MRECSDTARAKHRLPARARYTYRPRHRRSSDACRWRTAALRAAAPTEETLVNPCHWVGEAQALCINSADAALPSPHTRRSIRWGGTRRRLDACLKGRSQLAFDWQIFRALTSSKSSYSLGPKSLMRLATWFAKSMRSAFNLPSERCWPGNSAMIRGGRDLENLCQHHAACRIDRVLT